MPEVDVELGLEQEVIDRLIELGAGLEAADDIELGDQLGSGRTGISTRSQIEEAAEEIDDQRALRRGIKHTIADAHGTSSSGW